MRRHRMRPGIPSHSSGAMFRMHLLPSQGSRQKIVLLPFLTMQRVDAVKKASAAALSFIVDCSRDVICLCIVTITKATIAKDLGA
jgi:hypothetical protein